jgi:hypothetical protein
VTFSNALVAFSSVPTSAPVAFSSASITFVGVFATFSRVHRALGIVSNAEFNELALEAAANGPPG